MRRFAIASLLVVGLVTAGTAALALKVGDKAPEIKVAKWVKGAPVTGFEKGKVYVVEFWATWCGPCKVTIPHLTEMAKKYKDKCTFTGVSVWERGDDIESQVSKFVDTMGEKMEYNVALDDRTDVKKGWMAENWMEAAQQNGIPAAFVIGKDSKIAWIGHPMDDMEAVVGDVIADKFDPKSVAARKAKQQAEMDKLNSLMTPIAQKAQSGKNKEALTDLNQVLAKNPQYEAQLSGFKLNLLMQTDEAKAYPYARKLADGQFKDNAMMLNQLAWMIVDDKGQVKLKKPDYATAVAIAERAAEVSKYKDPMILDTLAFAYYKKGSIDKAIETQEKAVALLGEGVPEEMRKDITGRLELFKSKKK